MDDADFRRLLDFLGFSWPGYRRVRRGVKKRLVRHMLELGCRNLEDYLQLVKNDAETRKSCILLTTVSISRFFRDRRLWELLEDEIVPALINQNEARLKVWFAGCACGEEVYSFKIIYRRWQDLLGAAPRLEILATDLNPDYLEKARTGIYNPSSLRDASEEVKSAYFSVRGRHFSLDPALKTGLVWREHDLLSGPPDGLFDLVFLRNNILTYYPEHLKTRALKNAFQALVQGGFLIIGAHEKLPATAKGLSGYAGEPYIFRKIDQGP